MPMHKAKDEEGIEIHISKANRYSTYKCPECLEIVNVRKGYINTHSFAHPPIPDRTPMQRMCSFYTGDAYYSKITNKTDKMYIANGGIPLYLANENEKFELRAYFPAITENSLSILRKSNIKICVNYNASSDIDKAEYSVNNLNYYKVDIIKPWIDVKCNPPISLQEVERKWLWGIRGIDVEKDIYHSNKDGGYRVVLKATISVGKTYRIMFESNPPVIHGCEFNKIGVIRLRKGYFKSEFILNIFSLKINAYTEEVRRFVESKGYKLLDSISELIPVWPPAVFEGKDLKYDQSNAFFLHIDKTNKENVFYSISNYSKQRVDNNSKSKIISIPTDNKTLTVSDLSDGSIENIKFNIKSVNSLLNKPLIKLLTTIKDSDGNSFNFLNNKIKPPKDGKLSVNSNLPFTAIISNDNYIVASSNIGFEKVRFFDELTLDSKAFGSAKYEYEDISKNKKTDTLDYEQIYSYLYKCTAPTINATTGDIELLYLLGKNIGLKEQQLYRLIEYWIKTDKIPLSAIEELKKIKFSLGGKF